MTLDGLRCGHWVIQPFAGIGQIRSAGITDLRHGSACRRKRSWIVGCGQERLIDDSVIHDSPHGVVAYGKFDGFTVIPAKAGIHGSHALDSRLRGNDESVSSFMERSISQKSSAMVWCPWRALWAGMRKRGANWRLRPNTSGSPCGMNPMELLSRPEMAQQLVSWLGRRLTAAAPPVFNR